MNAPKLTYPQLDLAKGEEVIAYRAIVRVFQNDPTFGTVITQWVIWDGSVNDGTEPSYAQCPYCSVSPFPTESSWITEGQHSMPITLRVLLAVAGTNFDQIGNLWGAMRRAVFPKNNAAQRTLVVNQLTNAGITRPTIQVSAYGQRTDNEGAKFMVADGTIKFGMLIST